jgi:hypothetical protein
VLVTAHPVAISTDAEQRQNVHPTDGFCSESGTSLSWRTMVSRAARGSHSPVVVISEAIGLSSKGSWATEAVTR